MQSFLRVLAFVAVVVPLATACSGGPGTIKQDYRFPAEQPSASRAATWFEGKLDGEQVSSARWTETSPEDRYVAGEVAYWDGDAELAFRHHRTLLRTQPDHPLSRFASARLYDLRNEVVDFDAKLRPVLEALRYDQLKLNPLTVVYVGMLAQHVARNDWLKSESMTPFDGNAVGFPMRWRHTPMLSPYRLSDMAKPFAAIESGGSLSPDYISPYFAEDVAQNRRETRRWMASGVNLVPRLGRRGIYYLETWLTVEGDQDQGMWVFGNFAGATKVWLNGEVLFSRDETDYSTGKRIRRVKLAPGQYRVLVKLAYEPGYRDWFDLGFYPDEGKPLGPSKLRFNFQAAKMTDTAKVTMQTKSHLPSELERVMVAPDQVSKAAPMDLYLTALASIYDREAQFFEPAIEALLAKHPRFAAARAMRAEQLQTLWEIPSKLRDASSLKELRAAAELAPKSVRLKLELHNWLRKRGKNERELRGLVESMRDGALSGGSQGRLRNVVALERWADYLEDQRWAEEAEKVWRQIVRIAPERCKAARNLQSILHGRNIYGAPSTLTPAHAKCPDLDRALIRVQDNRREDQLALAERRAKRYPYSAGSQVSWADALRSRGKLDQARKVLEEAKARTPWSLSLWSELADVAHANEGKAKAVAILEEAAARNGNAAWLVYRKALMEDRIPLVELMRDGKKAAMEAVAASGDTKAMAADEAYYVIDFAARRYFEDGSSVTLTHTMVRVMTKGAIDRYAETTKPANARLIHVRTIKQDGTVLEPQRMRGKSTLSMPGLAEGDFVELAYVQYNNPSGWSRSHRDGVKFFFKMANISSLHSEYVVLGTEGQFVRRNNAPQAEPVELNGIKGYRFLKRNSPRPRAERYSVEVDEYLPWIQLYSNGLAIEPFEAQRRAVADTLLDSLKRADNLPPLVEAWSGKAQGKELVKKLFYAVNNYFPDPSPRAWRTEVAHAVAVKEGSPFLVLKQALDLRGIRSDLMLVRPSYADPYEHPLHAWSRYTQPLLRVKIGNETLWLDADGPDAMFASVDDELRGQPAVCVTCRASETLDDVVPEEGFVDNEQTVEVQASLDAKGNMSGELVASISGNYAVGRRRALRNRPDETSRRKFFDRVLANYVRGATLGEVRIEGEAKQDEALVMRIKFTRQAFARRISADTMMIETQLFREPLATVYTSLADRTTPLFVGWSRRASHRLVLKLPAGQDVAMRTATGPRTIKSEFGSYQRNTAIEGETLTVSSTISMPVQRVPVDKYEALRRWAIEVERSSVLLLGLKAATASAKP